MRRTVVPAVVALAVLLAFASPSLGGQRSAAAPAGAAAVIDFNGDGFDDLAVGAPGENTSAGAVNVLYGSGSGLTGANQTITQANAEAGDRFGTALTKGDFDGDGITDLAVGASGEGVSGAASAGVVSVFYGTEDGLPGSGQNLFQGNPEQLDLFGAAVAAGRFNSDGFDDLAVGAPGETVGGAQFAGAVSVFYGSSGGLGSGGQAVFQAASEAGDQFGGALLADLLNGGMDALSDLAVGAPGETVRGAQFAGAVDVFYGTASGLPSAQAAELVQNNPEPGDAFGSALAAGNFGYEDSTPDLAVGAPGESVGTRQAAGAVSILLGVSGGLAPGGPDFVQGPTAAGGNPEAGDAFGFSLASGVLQNSAFDDLAVGVPGEDLGGLTDTGVVHPLFGGIAGLVGGTFVSQDSVGVPGLAESGDAFGGALTTGHYASQNTVPSDLAIGTPSETVGTAREAGAVVVLRGIAESGPPSAAQQFTQGRVAGGQPELLDNFGAALG
jgi:hypothetical protein